MHKRERGQSLVEFALSFGLLMIIMLGVLDLGRAFHAAMVMTNAAREGAYYGAMHPADTDGIVAHVIQEAQDSGILLGGAGVTVSSSGVSGTPLVVTVEYQFPMLSFATLGTFAITLQRSAQMVIY